MPMPKPNKNEDKKEYLKRFMSDELMVKEYPDEKQRMAIALQQWKGEANEKEQMTMNDLLSDRSEKVEDVEILNCFGNSLGVKFTEKDLDEIIENFEDNKEKYKPNVKIDHSKHQSILKEIFQANEVPIDSEIPNLGYIDKMHRKGQALFANIADIPKKLKDKVFGGQYKAVSPEIYMNFRGTGKKFIESIALTNYPRLKHAYNLSETAIRDGNSLGLGFSGELNILDREVNTMSGKKEQMNIDEKFETFSDKIISGITGIFKKEEKLDDTKTLTMSEVQAMIDTANEKNLAEMNEYKKAIVEKDEKLKMLSERFVVVEQNARKEKVEAICQKAKMEGVKPANVERFKPVLLSEVADEKIKFSAKVDEKDVEVEKTITEFIVDFFESNKGQVDFSEKTYSTVNPPDEAELGDKDSVAFSEIEKIAAEYRKQGLSEYEAMNKASDDYYGGK